MNLGCRQHVPTIKSLEDIDDCRRQSHNPIEIAYIFIIIYLSIHLLFLFMCPIVHLFKIEFCCPSTKNAHHHTSQSTIKHENEYETNNNKNMRHVDAPTNDVTPKPPPRRQNPFNRPAPPPPNYAVTSATTKMHRHNAADSKGNTKFASTFHFRLFFFFYF